MVLYRSTKHAENATIAVLDVELRKVRQAMTIADLPDWGEVRVFVSSRPMTPSELADGCNIVEECLREFVEEFSEWVGMTPLVAPVETYLDQVIAFGYAAQWPSRDGTGDTTPYLITGSFFDPFMDRLYLFAQRQVPAFTLEPDDVIILPSGPAPFLSALTPVAERGELDRGTLVITGGPVSRWKSLGAIHPLSDDEEYYRLIRESLAHRNILLP